MHKPCLSTGEYNCDVPKALVDLLMTKKVDLVVSGHEHLYQRTKQLALGPGCTTLTLGSFNPACVVDSDNDVARGAGTVFTVVGTGGVPLRDVNTSDPESAYFVTAMGANLNPTYGFSDLDVTPDQMSVSFVRGAFSGNGTYTDSFTITKGAPPPKQDPVAAFTSQSTGLQASFDGTGSADPDGGSIAGYAWDFGDGQTGSGATPTHTYALANTYPVGLTVTDDEGATNTITKNVTVTSGPQVIGADAFERTTTSTWGTADTGGAWTTSTGASVSGGLGRLVMSAAGRGATANLSGVSTTDLDLSFELSLDKIPAGTNAGVDGATVLRRTAGGVYQAFTRVKANGSVRVDFNKVVGGTTTAIGSALTVPGLTLTAADTLEVRAQATGTGPTTLRVKVWKKGSAEPAAWQVVVTDSTAGLQAPGSIGLFPFLNSSATNAPIQARYDDLRAAIASTVP